MWRGAGWDPGLWICFDVPISAKVSLQGCRLPVGSDSVTPESISRPFHKLLFRIQKVSHNISRQETVSTLKKLIHSRVRQESWLPLVWG